MINDKGRSMVEMLGVLAIIGVLSAGALVGYSKAMFQHKMNQTIDAFNGILQKVMEFDTQSWDNNFYIGYEYNKSAEDTMTYGLLNNCQKIQGGFWNDDNACKLPVGSFQMTLGKHNNNPAIGGLLIVNFTDSKSCIAFLSAHWENATPIDWWTYKERDENTDAGIQVCYESCSNDYLYAPQRSVYQMDMQSITNACQMCDNEDSCSVVFTIRYVW